MNEPELRRATAAHADKLTALARAAYARHVPVIGREPMPMTAEWARLLSEQEIWILEGSAGEVVASLALDVQADHVMVWSVAVAPAQQQRGLGRRLMAFAEERASALRRPELRLFTNARMAGNIALMGRRGKSGCRLVAHSAVTERPPGVTVVGCASSNTQPIRADSDTRRSPSDVFGPN